MLTAFRKGVTSKIMLVILAIGLFAIVATGFGTDGIGGLGGLSGSGDAVASVGGESVTSAEVTDQVNRQLAAAREQQPELDLASFLRGGALQEIVEQLISQKALNVFAREHGFIASKRLIDGEIASIPAFRNLAGQFDPNAFRTALQRENISEQQLREDLAGAIVQRQLLLPVAGSARVPEGVAFQYASLLLEQRSGTVGIVPAQTVGPGRQPTEAEVNAFYTENQTRYTVPERRVVRYALFGLPQVAAAARATDAEIATAYRSNPAYAATQTRTLSQVVLPSEQAARQFAQRVAQGTSFQQAAQQSGFSAADIAVGQQSRDAFARLTNPAIANAAFSVAQGAVTAPMRSELGWHVVRVDVINATAARPLAAVRDEIARGIEQQKSQQALADLITKIEDAIGDGSTFEEVARANGLAVQQTPPITATGTAPGTPGYTPPAQLVPLLKSAFDLTEDDDPVVEAVVPNQSFAIVGVGQIVPAAPPALAQIRDRVRADLVAKMALDRARAVATSIVNKINAGTPTRQAFAGAGVQLPAPQAVNARRVDIAQGQQVPPPLAMMFSLPKGKARLLPAPNGAGWFIVHLEQVVPGNARSSPELVAATRAQFARVIGEEYASQFSRAVEGRLDIERNGEAVQALRRQLMGPGSR